MKIRYLKESSSITDEFIINLYFNKDEHINSNYLKKEWLQKHPDINEYLVNRYDDSLSYKETLYRILLGIEERPVCKVCGKSVRFDASHRFHRNRNGWPFMIYCSPKCQANDPEIREKHKQTNLERYGVDNPAKVEEIKEKIRNTNIERYGVKNPWSSDKIKDKIKKTNLERYGVDHVFKSPEFIKKREQTNIEKYGTKTYGESDIAQQYKNKFIEKAKQTCLKKYGVDSYAKSQAYKDFIHNHREEISQKQYETKKKNNSFNISAKEDYLFVLLDKNFDNVIRQYKSEKYPFACDFYIPSFDLYIEYNGNWTHGNHPYNETDNNDIIRKAFIEEKSQTSKFYMNALHVWTISDVHKRNTAMNNCLNYLEIYPNISLDSIPYFIRDNYTTETTDKQIVIGDV